MSQDLPDDEVSSICAGLTRNNAKIRYLQRMGLTVRAKPNGKPLVNRAHYDAVMNGSGYSRPATARGPVWSVAA